MDIAEESIVLREKKVRIVVMSVLSSWELNSPIPCLEEVLMEVRRVVVEAEEEACRTCHPVEGAAEAAEAAALLL